MLDYNIHKPWETLDPWQEEVIKEKGNIVVRSGRQSGKSTAIAIKAGDYAMKNPKSMVLVIAAVERQAYLMFRKITEYTSTKYPKKQVGRATMTFVEFKNGSIIRCLPAGMDGRGIRGYTINLLIADEAAFINPGVWEAITPMIAITKGKIILLSTPMGRQGYFYDRFNDNTFKKFHIRTEDCPRMQTKEGIEFLKNEKKRMTELQYTQEYLGEFIDELRQYFPTKLIEERMNIERTELTPRISNDFFLGVDVAGMGRDETTLEILDRTNKERIKHVENIITRKTRTTETTREILRLNKIYDFKKIYVDDGGLGIAVFDQLLEEDETKRKVIAINNSARPLDKDGKSKKKILKEDLYNNLLRLMERKEISLLKDDEVFLSLKSIQYEYTDDGRIKIFGKYTHVTEGLIRAAWCVKDKSLNIYIY